MKTIHFPYFWSAQLDATQDQIDNPKDTSRIEGWIGMLLFNVAVWVTVVALDIHLFISEFQEEHSQAHVLQTATLVCVCVSASVIVLFSLVHMASDDHPFASGDGKEARVHPPFATTHCGRRRSRCHQKPHHPFASGDGKEARVLPPFATTHCGRRWSRCHQKPHRPIPRTVES